MRIGIIIRAKQGDIFEALEKRGWSQTKGAEFCGINQNAFCKLINMKWIPKKFSDELTKKLLELTGKLPEDLFPDWARENNFLSMPKVSKKVIEVTPLMLQEVGIFYLPPSQEEIYDRKELGEKFDQMFDRFLSARDKEIVRRHIMNEEPASSIAKDFNLTVARIKQICGDTLIKMRHPKLKAMLQGYTPPED